MKDEHAQFSGSVSAAYDRYLGPMLFQPYAEDLAARLQVAKNGSILELACGTGIFYARSGPRLTGGKVNQCCRHSLTAKGLRNVLQRISQADNISEDYAGHLVACACCSGCVDSIRERFRRPAFAHTLLI